MKKRSYTLLKRIFVFVILFALIHCAPAGKENPHRGLWPYRCMEKPPAHDEKVFELIGTHHHAAPNSALLQRIRPGDTIAFFMSHAEARKALRKGTVQKLPYELFSYGHLALVVPADAAGDWRLLQVAMGQEVNRQHGVKYLEGKSYAVYRPRRSFSLEQLDEFADVICDAAGKRARYDYLATLGLYNGGLSGPAKKRSFTCVTLLLAAYHHAGLPIHAVHRKGCLDVVTPAQVIRAEFASGHIQ